MDQSRPPVQAIVVARGGSTTLDAIVVDIPSLDPTSFIGVKSDSELECKRSSRGNGPDGPLGPAMYEHRKAAVAEVERTMETWPGAERKVTAQSGNRMGKVSRDNREKKRKQWWEKNCKYGVFVVVVVLCIFYCIYNVRDNQPFSTSDERRLSGDRCQASKRDDVDVEVTGATNSSLVLRNRTSGFHCYSADDASISELRKKLGDENYKYVQNALTSNTMQSEHNQVGEPGDRDRDLYRRKERDGIVYRDLICETPDRKIGVAMVMRWKAEVECPDTDSNSVCTDYHTMKDGIRRQVQPDDATIMQADPAIIIQPQSCGGEDVKAQILAVAVTGFQKMVQEGRPLCASHPRCNSSVPKHVIVLDTGHDQIVYETTGFCEVRSPVASENTAHGRSLTDQAKDDVAFFRTEFNAEL